jgi:pyruvate dehydrogenase E1 component alpha subunit/2-oxoisovalerate dehydrogenase E1 component alpha subunit
MGPAEPRDDDPDVALLGVLSDDGTADPASDPRLPLELAARAYREMRRLRLLDEKLSALQRQGRIGFHAPALRQECVPVAAGLTVRAGDWVFPSQREQGVMLARGLPLRALVAQAFGNSGDGLAGRQLPGLASSRAVHQVSASSGTAPQLTHAVGAAWAMRARGTTDVALAFLDDGATSQPDFHAAMNLAGVWRVPCVLVTRSASGVPPCYPHGGRSATSRQTASRTIAVKGRAYGVPGVRVDGSDFLALVRVLSEALDRARSGGGATLIEAAASPRDPVQRLRAYLLRAEALDDDRDAAMERSLAAEVAAAIDEVERLPLPARESLFEGVYAEMPWHLSEQLAQLNKVPMAR